MDRSVTIAHAASRFQLYRERLRQHGYAWLFARLIKRLLIEAGWLLLLPVAIVLHTVGFRRVTVFTDRIGHLAAEIDCFLKERALGRLPNRHWFVLAPPHRVANRHLLEYWAKHIPVISSPMLCGLLRVMSWRWLMLFDVSHYILSTNKTAKYCSVVAEWGSRKPILELTAEDRERGWTVLGEMGVPQDAWFVCFHAREGGFSPVDEILHSHRNSDVLRLVPAMKFIASRGGWSVRMGDPTMKRLPPLPRVVDYAHHPLRSEWMDVFLCASCRLFVGSSSGLFIVSDVFGVPCALVNMVPLSTLGFSPRDVSIPKLLRRRGNTDYIRFEEAFDTTLANYRLAKLYEDAGIELEESSPEDILDLVKEMLGILEGSFVYDRTDTMLQEHFRSFLRLGHYSYGLGAQVGASFLRKYRQLLN